jgi:hypothetical protein
MTKTVLFVGCGDGLGDANLSGLLKWISELQEDLPRTHTILINDGDKYNFRPLVRLKYGSRHSDLGPWLWNELLENKDTEEPPTGRDWRSHGTAPSPTVLLLLQTMIKVKMETLVLHFIPRIWVGL